MMGIGLESDEAVGGKIIDDALHVLAIAPHVPREPGHRLSPLRRNDGPEHLPSSVR